MADPQMYLDAIRTAVRDALRPYGDGAATVTEGYLEQARVDLFEISPRDPAAAAASVAYLGDDEVTLGFGETHTYLWDEDPVRLGAEIGLVLAAVFAGDFVEYGFRGDSTARLSLPGGRRRTVGNIPLPVPWRLLGMVRRYRPYGSRT